MSVEKSKNIATSALSANPLTVGSEDTKPKSTPVAAGKKDTLEEKTRAMCQGLHQLRLGNWVRARLMLNEGLVSLSDEYFAILAIQEGRSKEGVGLLEQELRKMKVVQMPLSVTSFKSGRIYYFLALAERNPEKKKELLDLAAVSYRFLTSDVSLQNKSLGQKGLKVLEQSRGLQNPGVEIWRDLIEECEEK